MATITMNNSNNQNHHHHHLSCADVFLDFSSTHQGAHRRSISDSVAFLNQPLVEENKVVNGMMTQPNMFDGLDGEQLKSIFSDDFAFPVAVPTTVSSSYHSTPPDQNSHNYEKPAPGEVESSCNLLETHASEAPSRSNGGDSITDPKRVKRILANRQSAQRSRVKKLQYISELERSVTTLQSEVSALSPRVAFLDHQRLVLTVENSSLKQRIAALAQDKIFKDAHQESLRKEIERLTQVYLHQQSLQQINNHHPQPQQQQLLPPLPPRNEGQQLIS